MDFYPNIKFRDYFNRENIIDLGYGYMGCFMMWLVGTNDTAAINNVIKAAYKRHFDGR